MKFLWNKVGLEDQVIPLEKITIINQQEVKNNKSMIMILLIENKQQEGQLMIQI